MGLAHIGSRIRGARIARGLSQAALAEQAGISRNTVVQIELAGVNGNSATLDAIAGALGVELADLLRDEDSAA